MCALLASAVGAGGGSSASAQPAAACGAATAATLASVAAMVATNIYRGELGDTEAKMDLARVTSAPDLQAAVAADSPRSTLTAVKRIVYHPFWHIVRLRVLDAQGRVLADFGGPYVIAPVDGVLRSATGAVIGSFVMAVQDDVGYAKLEHRALGDPIGIYVNRTLAVELAGVFPKLEPSGGEVKLAGMRYGAETLTLTAFPSGALDAVIAIAPPTATLRSQSCAAVDVAEIGLVAERLSMRFHPLAADYAGFVQTVSSDTGAIVIVRIGERAIAGSGGPGPAVLPTSGAVSYDGKTWAVFSFAPTPPARIYLLVAAT